MASETHETSSAQPEMKDVEKGVEGGLASEAAVPPAPSSEEAAADDSRLSEILTITPPLIQQLSSFDAHN